MKWILISFVRCYQRYLSRFFAGSCIYQPSCSNYAIEAIVKHGCINGVKMTVSRLLRCRPPYEGGKDIVS